VNCSEYREYVAADVDGVLGAEADAARRHLERCPACRAEREQQTAVRGLIRSHALPDLPIGLRTRVLAAIAEESRRSERPRVFRWAWVGAAAVAALVAVLVVRSRTSPFGAWMREYDLAARGALAIDFPTHAPDELEGFYRQHQADGIPAHVVDLSRAGFRLVGGALASFPDRRARLSVYSDGEHFVVCDYLFAKRFPRALPASGEPVFFSHADLNFCARRIGDEVCVLITRMPIEQFRRRLEG
jgi:anti-sigma factor RsiW